MASLQHLGGDRWRVRLYDTTNGRQVSRSFTAKGERAAKRQAAQVEVELREALETRQQYAASVGALVDEWLALRARDCSPSTMIAYRRHAARIKKRLGSTPADELTGRMIDAWYDDLYAGGMSAANVQHVHRVLRAILTFGFEDRDLPRIATKQSHPRSHQAPEMRPPTPAAIEIILSSLPTDREWARAVRLLTFTGLRRGEVVGLRWDLWHGDTLDVAHSIVEVPGQGVAVRVPKGKRSREVDLSPLAVDVLDQQRRWQQQHDIDSPWVFPDLISDSSGQRPRRPGWVSLMWGRHRGEYGADAINLHALRHHFATFLLDGGTPLNTVQHLLGHAQASTTSNIYGHSSLEGRAHARERMKQLGGGQSPAPLPPPGISS